MSKLVFGLAAIGAFVVYKYIQTERQKIPAAVNDQAAALKARLQEMIPGIGSDMLLPPPGRTVTASGQVLGDLGREWGSVGTRLPPSGVVGDTCTYTVRGVSRPYYVSRINTTRAGSSPAWELDTVREQREKQEADRYATLQRQIDAQATAARVAAQEQVNATLAAIQKRADEDMAAQAKAEQEQAPPVSLEKKDFASPVWGVERVYHVYPKVVGYQIPEEDSWNVWKVSHGKGTMTLTEARGEASSRISQAKTEYFANKAASEKKRAEKLQAQQKYEQETGQPSTYEQAKQAYDAVQAAREQASMSQASSDTGYGQTSNDTGYGATQQVTEEGAPKLPEQISQVQTPSAQMLPQQAPAAAPTGNSKVGLIVGGGVLAAIAAAMAS